MPEVSVGVAVPGIGQGGFGESHYWTAFIIIYQPFSMFVNIDPKHLFVMPLVEAPNDCQGLPLTVFVLVFQVGLLGCPQK